LHARRSDPGDHRVHRGRRGKVTSSGGPSLRGPQDERFLYRPDGTVKGMTALMLAAAIGCEVLATLALKASDGFSRPGPIALVVIGYGVSFALLAVVLKHLSVGTTYAIWSAAGTAAVTLIGIALYGEGASALKLASLGLIVLGVVGLNAA